MGKLPSYFENVKKLYEAAAVFDGAQQQEVVPQEQIADSGSDVLPANPQQEMAPEEEMPVEEDPMAMQQPMMPQPEPTPSMIVEKQKLVKMFDRMNDLITNIEALLKLIDNLQLDALELEQIRSLSVDDDHLHELRTKIIDYLTVIFNGESYDSILYAYVLFRTELIETIKSIKNTLQLTGKIMESEEQA